MKVCKECERLKAELAVRVLIPLPSRPEQFRKRGVASAFDCGYKRGWQGLHSRNLYVRSDCIAAYQAGYTQGAAESASEIARVLDARKAKDSI